MLMWLKKLKQSNKKNVMKFKEKKDSLYTLFYTVFIDSTIFIYIVTSKFISILFIKTEHKNLNEHLIKTSTTGLAKTFVRLLNRKFI